MKAYRATAQEQELARIDYIIDHVTSVHVRAQLLSGQTMSYDEMTDGLYGLVAPEYDPKPMQDLLSDLQQVLPGSGSVQEKIAAFRSRITVPTEHLLQVLTGATQFFHDETVRHMHVTGNSMPRVRVRALADPRSDFCPFCLAMITTIWNMNATSTRLCAGAPIKSSSASVMKWSPVI